MAPSPPASFVGRGEELGLLGSLLADARSRQPRLVVILGESGVGKTRLVNEALAVPSGPVENAVLVLRGGATVAGAGIPFLPIAAALRPIFAAESDADALHRWPELAPLAPRRAGPGSPMQPRGMVALFESVHALMQDLTSSGTVALVLDDMHWSDPSSVDLVSYLLGNVTRERLLVVLMARPTVRRADNGLARHMGELLRLPICDSLDLAPLARPEVAKLMTSLGVEAPSDDSVDAVMSRSGGLPLLVQALTEAGDIGVRASPARALRWVEHEIAELPPETRELVVMAAIAGREVSDAVLAEMAGRAVDDLHERLQTAFERGVLVAGQTADTWAFRHDLYREAALMTLPPPRRRRLHARLAQLLATRPDLAPTRGAAAELAHHHELAGAVDEALDAALTAAEEARAHSAAGDVALLLGQVLRLARSGARHPALAGGGRARIAREAAAGHWLAGDAEQAGRYGREALDALDPEQEPTTWADTAAELARALLSSGHREEARELLQRADHLTAPLAASPSRARALAALAQVEMMAEDDTRAAATAERAKKVAEAADAPVTGLHARTTEATALHGLGRVEEGDRLFTDVIAEAAQAVELHVGSLARDELDDAAVVLARALHNAALGATLHGWPHRGEAFARRGLEVVATQRLGQGYRSHLSGQLALAHLTAGRHGAAMEVLGNLPQLPKSRIRVSALEAEISAALMAGDCDEAGRLLRAAGHWDELVSPLTSLEIDLALQTDRPEEALARAKDAVATTEQRDLVPYATQLCAQGIEAAFAVAHRAETDGLATEVAQAHNAARDLRLATDRAVARSEQRNGTAPPATAVWAAIAEAWECEMLDTPQAAAAAWSHALVEAAAGEMRPLRARAGVGLGRALLRTGQREEAARVLATAEDEAHATGSQPLAAAVDHLRRRAHLDSGRRRRDLSLAEQLGVTPRELQVLAGLADGLTNGEIGARLFISTKTASVHVSNILRKLDVPHRRAAAARARDLGLLSPGAPTT